MSLYSVQHLAQHSLDAFRLQKDTPHVASRKPEMDRSLQTADWKMALTQALLMCGHSGGALVPEIVRVDREITQAAKPQVIRICSDVEHACSRDFPRS